MKTPFREAHGGFSFANWDESPSKEEALHFLQSLARTTDGIRNLRRVLWDLSGTESIAQLDDLEVIDRLASQLASGTFRVWETPAAMPNVSLHPVVEELPPPEQAESMAALTVTVMCPDNSVKLADVTVEISGASSGQDTTKEGTGKVTFENLPAGDYQVTATLTAEQLELYGEPSEVRTSLLEHERGSVTVRVELINVVTPLVEPEYKVVLLDRNLSQHQGDGETKIFADPTRIELSLTQTNTAHPPTSAIKLKCAPANVDVFLDEECSQQLDGDPSSGAPLTRPMKNRLIGGRKLELFIRGKTAGKFKVSLDIDDPADPLVTIDTTPHEQELGVVELIMELHQHDATALDGIEVDPDLDPPALSGNETYDPFATSPSVPKPEKYHPNLMKQYHDSLKDKALPDQKLMTDKEKVEAGRVLHVQKANSHGRAKLIVKKLTVAQWPSGTEDYTLRLSSTFKKGAATLHDAEFDGKSLRLPLDLDVSELKKADQEIWVEGRKASKTLRDVTLDVGVARPAGGLAKKPKHNGDWARFTVVEIREVKVDYEPEDGKAVAWDKAKQRFYINLKKPDPDGRKVTIGAQLTEPLEGITVHFMLAPDKNNQKKANWGIDLPAGTASGPKKAGGLTIGGADSAKFSLDGMDLELDDGVLDEDVKDDYECTVKQGYEDGSTRKITVEYCVSDEGTDGDDSSGGIVIRTFSNDDFPVYKIPPWKWNKISSEVKRNDKASRKKLLHLSATTEKGYAKKELTLSRFGGDKFRPACYIDQDPHLAKYVHGHKELQKRRPISGSKSITIYRKFWYQRVTVTGIDFPEFTDAQDQYKKVKVTMDKADDLVLAKGTVNGYDPQAIYPKYMIEVNGGNSDALVVSDDNKAQFFTGFVEQDDKPNMIPILVCHAQWDPKGNTAALSLNDLGRDEFPVNVNVGKKVLTPPLQGGDLLVSGTWEAAEWDPSANGGAGDWVNFRSGDIDNAQVSIDENRGSLNEVQIALPPGVAPTADTLIDLKDIVVKGAKDYLGESFDKKILAVYDPGEPEDYQNTIVHEIGHAYFQVIEGDPAGGTTGVPRHPVQINAANQGNHCRCNVNKCVMYDSGPVDDALNRYCDICHPYLLVQDMTDIT